MATFHLPMMGFYKIPFFIFVFEYFESYAHLFYYKIVQVSNFYKVNFRAFQLLHIKKQIIMKNKNFNSNTQIDTDAYFDFYDAFISYLNDIYFDGYAEQMAESNPEAFAWELNSFMDGRI